jgi:hypothetical protein
VSEKEIIKWLVKTTDHNKFPYQIPNAFIYGWETDFWTMTASGETREFEIKISRSDYLIDAKKDKHKECNGANYFYYVCPAGLIKPEEVDKRYGLVYISESGTAEIVKKPRRLNNNIFENWKMLCNKMHGRWWMLWKAKYIDKEITRSEYREGFNIQLTETEIAAT